MKLRTKILVATLALLPAAYASDRSDLRSAESFAEHDNLMNFLGLDNFDRQPPPGRTPPGRPPVTNPPGRQPPPPGYRPPPPGYRPPPPGYRPPPPGYRPPPPGYRPPPPGYRPPPPGYRPPPGYGYYTCYAENVFREVFWSQDSVAQWAQDDAMAQCLQTTPQCREMGCRYE